MSSGSFSRSRYERNNGNIHPIRIQPETLTLTIGSQANTAPTGAATSNISAKVTRGNRGVGLKPRTVTFAYNTAPAGYKQDSPITVPWLRESTFDAIGRGSTGTYNDVAVTVLYTSPERVG